MVQKWIIYFNERARKYGEDHEMAAWGSSESMYSRFLVALSKVQISKNMVWLDAGCGPGTFGRLITENFDDVKIINMDVSKEMVRVGKQKASHQEFIIGSITQMPFRNGVFDCITSIGVLQSLEGLVDDALKELLRVLKDGGQLFLETLDKNYIGFKNGLRQPNPIHIYFVPEDLAKSLRQLGLEILEIAAISTKKDEVGRTLPLHEWHSFFIYGRKCGKGWEK